MALFKICRGNETNLPSQKTDGYAYFCTDTGNFFIDWADSDGSVTRVQINADSANRLRYLSGDEYVDLDPTSIATTDYVDEAIANAGANVLTVTLDDNGVPNKTMTEVYNHVQNGGMAVLVHEGRTYQLTRCYEGGANFTWVDAEEMLIYTYYIGEGSELFEQNVINYDTMEYYVTNQIDDVVNYKDGIAFFVDHGGEWSNNGNVRLLTDKDGYRYFPVTTTANVQDMESGEWLSDVLASKAQVQIIKWEADD